jgi:GH15 family glucan-1,4-alpha-glucosidase
MPRDLPLGNGSLLINFDSAYHVRDIYFPHVGEENHTDGHVNHTGVWVAGRFAWLDDAGWERTLCYEAETLVTDVTLHHPDLAVTLHFTDAVDFDRDVFVRQVRVTNTSDAAREVRLFFHYDWHIEEVDGANTVYFAPKLNALMAYKDNNYFLAGGCVGNHYGIDDYATGYKEFNGMQGTWRDAEDGTLQRHPIAQGSVDATLGLHLGTLEAGEAGEAFHWLAVGRHFRKVCDLHLLVEQRTPASFIERTRNYWRLWVNKGNEPMGDLPKPMVDLYKRSLLIVATQMDHDGAIIAATDGDVWTFSRDSYAYMWPRDGALVANALSHSGYGEPTRAFFDFCRDVITDDGYLLHKYTPAGALGSSWQPWVNAEGQPQLPIQEDETALVVYSLWQHYSIFRDVEFIKPLYAPLVKAAANFMVNFREPHTRLVAPSYDLWEERYGIHAYTLAATYAGLRAAANFAEIFGETTIAATYRTAAEEIKAATRQYLWNEDTQRFSRRLTIDDHGTITRDDTMDMAICALFFLGMLDSSDPQMIKTVDALCDRLHVKTKVGGYARYEDDLYHQVSQDIANIPGNPWFICSCWAAQYQIVQAQDDQELHAALPMLQWVVDHALPSGVLAEQVDPFTDAPLSASPLTWSHAEYIATVRWYAGKHQRLMTPDHLAHFAGQTALGAMPGEPQHAEE